jgi:Big-like domain-containing protein/hemolysin type calcium-binding protein
MPSDFLTTLRLAAAGGAALILLLLALAPAAPAATVVSDGATVTFTADPGERDLLDLKSTGPDTVQFHTNGDAITESVNCSEVDADTTVCEATRVVVHLLDGDDTARGGEVTAQPLTITGDDGNDFVYGGTRDDDIRGGDGNDNLSGILEGASGGTDRLDGGPDDDTILVGSETDEAIGGPGSDRTTVILIDLTSATAAPADMSVTLDDAANDARPADGANVHSDVEHIGTYSTDLMENGVNWQWNEPPLVDEGRLTARGTDGPNSLWGGINDDDLDPLAGNDVVSAGIGNDSIRTVDGYADRVACGPGIDTVAADTLDDVSDSCEEVGRSDAGDAGDTPGAPEDAAPAVALTEASAGHAAATATDDRGVTTVLFLDDDRLVCADDAAPYTCDHRVGAEDVGRNTLTAIAVDTAQQTASDRRVVLVGRFAPVDVTLRVARRRASGRVVLPAQVAPGLGCTGAVTVKVTRGKRTIASRQAALRPDCTYAVRVPLRRGRQRVRAAFAGNDVLGARPSRVRTERVR